MLSAHQYQMRHCDFIVFPEPLGGHLDIVHIRFFQFQLTGDLGNGTAFLRQSQYLMHILNGLFQQLFLGRVPEGILLERGGAAV